MRLNLGCGKHSFDPSLGWVNIDRREQPGVDRTMNLWEFPWDFDDNSCEEFYLGHIVEHIPHEPRRSTGSAFWKIERWERLRNLDGFFCFFAEIWRIGTNGAIVQIVTPYGFTTGAFQDPTHTRVIMPTSFAYLTREQFNNDYDYDLPCMFTINSVSFDMRESLIRREEQFQKAIEHSWNMTRNMYVQLEVVK